MNVPVIPFEPTLAKFGGTRFLRWRGAGLPGSPLVFLHGLGDGADIWNPVLRAWPTGPVAALALDLPGHGGSDWLNPEDYTLPKITEHVARALTASAIRKPVIIGHSLGARVALKLASEGHIAAERIVLVDMNPEPKEAVGTAVHDHIDMLLAGAASENAFVAKVASWLPLCDPSVLKDVIPALVAAGKTDSEAYHRINHDPEITRFLTGPRETDVWKQLERLDVPTDLVRGEYSSVLDKGSLEKMRSTLRVPTNILTVPKAGHAIALEQPAALARRLAEAVFGRKAICA